MFLLQKYFLVTRDLQFSLIMNYCAPIALFADIKT